MESVPSFEALHEDFRPRVLAYLRRFVDPAEAEDLTQEVFFKVYQGLAGFREEARLSTWVFQIATHAALDRLKSAGHRASAQAVPLEGRADILPGAVQAPSPIQDDMCRCIRDMVDELPVPYRMVLVLADLKELRMREIAGILGLTSGAAKIRLHRARKMLRERMERGCRILLDERAEVQCDRKA